MNETMKKVKLILLLSLLALTGCACMGVDTAFGLDGKARSSCKRGKLAEEYCGQKPHHYDYYGLTCHHPCEISEQSPACKKLKDQP